MLLIHTLKNNKWYINYWRKSNDRSIFIRKSMSCNFYYGKFHTHVKPKKIVKWTQHTHHPASGVINPVTISFIIYTLSPPNYFVANIRQHMTSSLNISVYISKIIKLFENIKCCYHIYDNNALIYLQFTLVSTFLHILFESGYTRYKGVPHWNWWL